ncbi:uncharacterized protein [Mytilus edulis]|uniref:uncharacterized protein n=1 Tax=Mytilus edulis TaxID=6550 RepID=UPI0039EED768
MGKIRMCNVVWFVLEYTIVFVSGESELLDVTLCENSGNAEVFCPENKTITWKSILYGEFSCQNADNRAMCHSNINTFFNDHCLGQNNCTLPVLDILSNYSCERSPIRVTVSFTCSGGWWQRNRHPSPVETCANTLTEVNCPSDYYIHFKGAMFYSTPNSCDMIDTKCASNTLKGFCDEKRSCISDETKTSCLYHKRFARIQYACQGQNESPVTDTIHQSTSSDHELDITTIPAVNATTENDNLPVFSFDKGHRIEINHQSLNGTLYMCSLGWDNFDAGVLCKSLNRNWIGKATVVNNIQNLKIAPYSLQCGGLETSLFECNYTKDEQGCNIGKVAGAICCEDTDKPGECVMNSSSDKVSNESSNIAGIHVTIVSALSLFVTIVAALVIILIVCYRKKTAESFKPCQTQENTATTERTDSSNYNVINYNEMSDISIIKINEKRNEIPTIQHHLQNIKTSIKQNKNICTKNESLSTNQNSLEHIYESDSMRNNLCESLTKQQELDTHTYESTEFVQPPDIKTSMEQDQNICHKYETLSTNTYKHIYESDSIHTNQYESLTKPPESDKHTFESTELTEPHDIEQDQHICIKYESLSTNRNSDKHIYESTHTNQYESLKKQQESDKHTYESTEHAQPHDIKISTDQEDNFCNKYESLSTNRTSVEHTYESTEQTLLVSQ